MLILLAGTHTLWASEARVRWELVSPAAGTIADLTVIRHTPANYTLILTDQSGTQLQLWTWRDVGKGTMQMGMRDLASGGELTVSRQARTAHQNPKTVARSKIGRNDELTFDANGRRKTIVLAPLKGDEQLLWTLDLRESLDLHFRRSLESLRDVAGVEEFQPFCDMLNVILFGSPCAPSPYAVRKVERDIDCSRDERLGFPCPKDLQRPK